MLEELLGPVANGWRYLTLGEVCRSGGGDIQTGPFGSQLHASDYVPIGIPSIMPQNIGDNRVVEKDIARITLDDAERLSRYRVRLGDIVYSRRGDVERRALIREHEDGWLCGTGCLRIRVGHSVADPVFSAYYLGHPAVREWIVRHAHGATMPNLNTSILSACPFVLPLLADQRAIASVLGSLDDKIDLNRRMNQTLEVMARTIFKDWFVDFGPTRAKMEGRAPYLVPDLWSLFPDRLDNEGKPQGWITSTVGVEFRLTMGQSPPGETYNKTGEGLPFFQGRTDFCARYPKRRMFCSAPTRIAEADDTLVSVRAPVGDLNMAWEQCCVGRGVAAVRHLSGHRGYTYYSVLSLQPDLAAFEHTGTVFGAINKAQFEILKITAPDSRAVEAFEALVTDFDERIRLNEIESATLASARDILLPKLMSGEIRVKDAEKIAEAAQ